MRDVPTGAAADGDSARVDAGASGSVSRQAGQPAKQQIWQSALRPWGCGVLFLILILDRNLER